jgi:5'-deoxynucleotidase YfbR-like HD superfamily hydrolase
MTKKQIDEAFETYGRDLCTKLLGEFQKEFKEIAELAKPHDDKLAKFAEAICECLTDYDLDNFLMQNK